MRWTIFAALVPLLFGCPGTLVIGGSQPGDDDSAIDDDDVQPDDDDVQPDDDDVQPDDDDIQPDDDDIQPDDDDVQPDDDDATDPPCDAPEFFVKGELSEFALVFVNDGAGNFAAPFDLDPPTGNVVWAALAGDFDGDGVLDVFVERAAEAGQAAHLFFGTCDGELVEIEIGEFPMPGLTDFHSAADVDGDGDLDVVGWDWGTGNGRTWLNDGGGTSWTFLSNTSGSPAPFDLQWTANDIDDREVVGLPLIDFTFDGLPDIVECSNEGFGASECDVHLGVGDGTFSALLSFEVDRLLNGIAVADFDGDGVPDLVGGLDDDGDAGQAWMWPGDPSGILPAGGGVEVFDVNPGDGPDDDAPGYGWMYPYDVEGDGDMDILLSIADPLFGTNRELYVALNDGSAGFTLTAFDSAEHQWGNDDFIVQDVLAVPVWP